MRTVFHADAVVPGVPGIILLSHGALAAGLLDASQIVFGEVENAAALCLEPGDDLDKFSSAAGELIAAFDSCIVLVDMKGGTPCNLLLRYAKEHHLELNVITGASLPMLLEVLGAREAEANEALRNAGVDAAQLGIADLSSYLKN